MNTMNLHKNLDDLSFRLGFGRWDEGPEVPYMTPPDERVIRVVEICAIAGFIPQPTPDSQWKALLPLGEWIGSQETDPLFVSLSRRLRGERCPNLQEMTKALMWPHILNFLSLEERFVEAGWESPQGPVDFAPAFHDPMVFASSVLVEPENRPSVGHMAREGLKFIEWLHDFGFLQWQVMSEAIGNETFGVDCELLASAIWCRFLKVFHPHSRRAQIVKDTVSDMVTWAVNGVRVMSHDEAYYLVSMVEDLFNGSQSARLAHELGIPWPTEDRILMDRAMVPSPLSETYQPRETIADSIYRTIHEAVQEAVRRNERTRYVSREENRERSRIPRSEM
jgi:hypothetical protein